jgi:hypothetical protein
MIDMLAYNVHERYINEDCILMHSMRVGVSGPEGLLCTAAELGL